LDLINLIKQVSYKLIVNIILENNIKISLFYEYLKHLISKYNLSHNLKHELKPELEQIAGNGFDESNIRYTNVLGFRPDNWFDVPVHDYVHMRSELDTMAVSNTNFCGDLFFDDWRTPDFIWRAGAAAADIFCMRFLDSYLTDGIPNQLIHWGEHSVPCYYQARSFIDGRNTTGHVVCEIITPNAPFPWTKDSYTDNYYKVRWHELSLEERYQYCVDLKISPRDYQVDLSINDQHQSLDLTKV
jgi:hypothetical protein